MRRATTVLASVLEAAAVLCYGAARSAGAATVHYSVAMMAAQLHMSGAWSCFYDLGGRDVPTLSSVANTLANVTGLVVPYLVAPPPPLCAVLPPATAAPVNRSLRSSHGASLGLSVAGRGATAALRVVDAADGRGRGAQARHGGVARPGR